MTMIDVVCSQLSYDDSDDAEKLGSVRVYYNEQHALDRQGPVRGGCCESY